MYRASLHPRKAERRAPSSITAAHDQHQPEYPGQEDPHDGESGIRTCLRKSGAKDTDDSEARNQVARRLHAALQASYCQSSCDAD